MIRSYQLRCQVQTAAPIITSQVTIIQIHFLTAEQLVSWPIQPHLTMKLAIATVASQTRYSSISFVPPILASIMIWLISHLDLFCVSSPYQFGISISMIQFLVETLKFSCLMCQFSIGVSYFQCMFVNAYLSSNPARCVICLSNLQALLLMPIGFQCLMKLPWTGQSCLTISAVSLHKHQTILKRFGLMTRFLIPVVFKFH